MTFSDIHPFVRNITLFHTRLHGCTLSKAYDCRLFGIRSGGAILDTEVGEYQLREGAIAVFNTAQPYRLRGIGELPLDIYCFNYDLTQDHADRNMWEQPGTLEYYDESRIIEKVDCDELRRPIIVAQSTEFLGRARSMYYEFHSGLPYAKRMLEAQLTELLILAHRAGEGQVDRDSGQIAEVKRYIREHYAEPLTNLSIADTFGYHPNYLARIFRERTGMTLHRYLTDFRLDSAAAMLGSMDGSVEHIAVSCGFATSAHFAAAFRRKFGKSPTDYRKN